MNSHWRALQPGWHSERAPSLLRWCRPAFRLRVVRTPKPERAKLLADLYLPLVGGLPQPQSYEAAGSLTLATRRSFARLVLAPNSARTRSKGTSTLAKVLFEGTSRRLCLPCVGARNEFEPVASRTTGTPPAGDTSTAGSSPSHRASSVWVTASWETRVAPGGSRVKPAERARGRSPLCANKERAARPSFLGARSGPPSFLDTNELTRPTRDRCARRSNERLA